MSIIDIAAEVVAERHEQDTRWGEQNHPDHHPVVTKDGSRGSAAVVYGLPAERQVKEDCEHDREAGNLSWAAILIEEVVEALDAKSTESLREELIQVAAVAQAWVECIDRREPDHDDLVDEQQNEAAGWPD
jgi:hypothetical protein